MKKKLILLNEIGLNEVFTRAFINEGYEVISILKEPFVYKKSLRTKLMNIYSRLVRKDNNFYGKDRYKQLNKEVYKRLKKIKGRVDYTIIFRADYYSGKIVNLLRDKSDMMVTYQYDGWELGKGILRYKTYFDRVFFFEKDDLSKFGDEALPLTNCYFPDNNKSLSIDSDIYYIGTGTRPRIESIRNLYNRIGKKYKMKGIITIPEYQKEEQLGGLKLAHKGLSYKDNIALLKNSRCVVDIKFDYHNGLSFRFFEAMYYRKKIITNNESVKKYDFYHPANIFITDFENLDGIEEFLEKPYSDIEQKIVEKYGFANWCRYVLDRPPYQKILLP